MAALKLVSPAAILAFFLAFAGLAGPGGGRGLPGGRPGGARRHRRTGDGREAAARASPWASGFPAAERGSGRSAPATSRPARAMDIADHVRIASVTKTFTATAILQLVDAGQARPRRHARALHPGDSERRANHHPQSPRHDVGHLRLHGRRAVHGGHHRRPADGVHPGRRDRDPEAERAGLRARARRWSTATPTSSCSASSSRRSPAGTPPTSSGRTSSPR